jgi:hypothetical protein
MLPLQIENGPDKLTLTLRLKGFHDIGACAMLVTWVTKCEDHKLLPGITLADLKIMSHNYSK